MAKIYQRKCLECGVKFTPYNSNMVVCSPNCAYEFTKSKKATPYLKKIKREQDKAMKEATMTHSEWLNLLQKVFNTYIRERDKNKPCISCGRKLEGKFDAGHFYSVKPYYGLRFNEDNTWGQCTQCNQHKHGNLIEYAIRLPQRIGEVNYKWLQDNRHISLKLSIHEIKELINLYKEKTKKLAQ